MRLLLLFVSLALSLAVPVAAQNASLRALQTGQDSRGWEAVGRLDLGGRGFCTGALIAPNLVLTAAHCLFDPATADRIRADEVEFLAGWRNGRASAYRRVRRAVVHPDYIFEDTASAERVSKDIALLELFHPVRNTTVMPFETDKNPAAGDQIAVVSYAKDRSEAPSLQEICDVMARQQGVIVMSCDVDFGSSGAPVFSIKGNVARIVSVVSAKAVVKGAPVSLGTSLQRPLELLHDALAAGLGFDPDSPEEIRRLSSQSGSRATSSAKFVKP